MLVVGIYLAGMLALGIYVSRKGAASFEDFFLSGRRLGWAALAGTLVATYYGVDALVESSELSSMMGLTGLVFMWIEGFIFLILYLVSKRIKETFPTQVTLQEMMFDKCGKWAGFFTSLASFIYVLSVAITGIMATGFMFTVIFGTPFWVGAVVGAGVVTVYTLLGGLKAVVITDVIQFVTMMVMMGIVGLVSWYAIGGLGPLKEGVNLFMGEESSWFFQFSPGAYFPPLYIFALMASVLVMLVDPTIIQRISAAASPREARIGFAAGAPMLVAFSALAALIGMIAVGMCGLGNISFTHPDEAWIALATGVIPVGLLGLFLAGVAAAFMSTQDSAYLVMGGIIGYDIPRIFNANWSDEKSLRYTKIGIVISAIISIALLSVFKRVVTAWMWGAGTVTSSIFVPMYAFAFYRGKISKKAGAITIISGFCGYQLWYILTSIFGTFDEEWMTYTFQIGNFTFMQEYGCLIFLILMAIVFFVLNTIFVRKEEL